jgi:hypothetical protein
MERHKGAFQFKWQPRSKTNDEGNCNSEVYGVEDRTEPHNKCDSVACNNEDHLIHKVEEGGDVCTLAVAATDRVSGEDWKGYYRKTKNAKSQAINPGRGEADPHLELRDVNVESKE